MKAALIIDMPENCELCLLERALNCRATASAEELERMKKQKPLRCPLKAIPEKDNEPHLPDEYSDGARDGWNSCIDAICGKE